MSGVLPVLVVEDDASIREGLVDSFTARDQPVDVAVDGEMALERLTGDARYRAVVLDLKLPRMDGLEVLRRIRAAGNSTPVVVVTARGEEAQRIEGLQAGADDYLVKPFSLAELHARIEAVVRRVEGRFGAAMRLGDAEIDLPGLEVRRGGEVFRLKPREADLLRLLLERAGEVLDRATILKEVWGYDRFPTTRTVDTHVFSLRRKLEANPEEPVHLLTVHGVGYRLVRG